MPVKVVRMENKYTEQVYERLFNLNGQLKEDCHLLLVDRGGTTSELKLSSMGRHESIMRAQKKSCTSCPLHFECKKGRDICNGQLTYSPFSFDKICLYAGALGLIENRLDELFRILKRKGEIIVLVNNDSSLESQSNIDPFDMDDLIKMLNGQNLIIKSISTYNSAKDGTFFRLVICQ